jgi:hypothetical protein
MGDNRKLRKKIRSHFDTYYNIDQEDLDDIEQVDGIDN